MRLAILALLAFSFLLSLVLTYFIRPLAVSFGFVDKPGGRKIHANPKPLGGGVAIFWAFALPMLGGLLYVNFASAPDEPVLRGYWPHLREHTHLAGALLGAGFLMHLLGLIDDRRALGPYFKLFWQLAVITGLVWTQDLRILTILGPWPSLVLTVVWIGMVTNAFNFLDNMDGLSAGVAVVCGTAFFIATMMIHQWFVAAALALFLGATLGFLCFNFPPASIFMGDSGSLVIGFLLGVLTVRTSKVRPGEDLATYWYAVFMPVVVLAVPLYDFLVVSAIRLGRGKSPFVGDTNHFSHRLVARGMSRRTAVLCLYLITAATAVGAILLPEVNSTRAAMLIFGQTLLILGVVALLEQHPIERK